MKTPTNSTDKDNPVDIFKRRILVVFFLIGIILSVALSLVMYAQDDKGYTYRIQNYSEDIIKQQQVVIRDIIGTIKNDVMFLSKMRNLVQYVKTKDNIFLEYTSQDFLTFSKIRKMYDQIRYLDATGKEKIRVNRALFGSFILKEDYLQDKGSKDFFHKALCLEEGELYISRMDLNVEYNKIETPFKPVLRVATPVFDDSGKKYGIVVLNYLSQHMFNSIVSIDTFGEGNSILVNGNGYFLYDRDKTRCFGFMFPEKQGLTFESEYNGTWETINTADKGHFYTPDGFFTFATIHPLLANIQSHKNSDIDVAEASDFYWKLIHFNPVSAIAKEKNGIRTRNMTVGLILFVLFSTIAWLFARLISRRQVYQRQLHQMALFDHLTGVPNRRLFFDRLEMSIRDAERYDRRFAVVYADLDGFKQVNDTLGHEAGDELLQQVACRFSSSCRKSDTLARLGGDEFAFLLLDIENEVDAATVAKKIFASLQEAISLKSGQALVATSIGVALYPEHGRTAREILRAADIAMYHSKKKGRGTITMASPEMLGPEAQGRAPSSR